jgi:curved DNA-binding protein CbpA
MSAPGGPTHYDVLGVAKDASPDEIKRQYRRLSRIVHSDTGGDDALFRLIQSAYDVLKNPDARRAYDRGLDGPAEGAPAGGGRDDQPPGHEGFGPAPKPTPPRSEWERATWEWWAQERQAEERQAQERQAQERQAQERQAQERQAWERAAREREAWERHSHEQGPRERQARMPRAGTLPGTDGGATTALVFSVLGFLCGVTFPVGFVMGLRARIRIADSNGTMKGAGRATAATIIGGIGTAAWLVAFAVGYLFDVVGLS